MINSSSETDQLLSRTTTNFTIDVIVRCDSVSIKVGTISFCDKGGINWIRRSKTFFLNSELPFEWRLHHPPSIQNHTQVLFNHIKKPFNSHSMFIGLLFIFVFILFIVSDRGFTMYNMSTLFCQNRDFSSACIWRNPYNDLFKYHGLCTDVTAQGNESANGMLLFSLTDFNFRFRNVQQNSDWNITSW